MTPLIGRDRELQALEGWLAGAPSRGGSLVIYGEPGIGKSALLYVAAERSAERGWRTLRTDGAPSETRLPFAALNKLLRPAIGEASQLAPAQRAALERAFGMVDAPAPQLFRVALAVLDLLTAVAGERPLLLLVEDTHWLDRTSSEVLAFVARRLASDPIFLLATSRPSSYDPLLEGIERRVQLGPLSDADAVRLLSHSGHGLDPRSRRAVLEAAAGNPLALVELPKAFSLDEDVDARIRWLPMTDRLERAFAARVSQLGEATRGLLLVAALTDADDVSVLIRAASLMRDRQVGVDDLVPATAAGLVAVRWRRVRFRHPLVRSAVYHAATPARRQAGHAALAEVLAGDPDQSAWHRAEATFEADESVALDLEAAARRAERRGATSEAIALWERSAQLSLPASGRSGRLLQAAELAADLGDVRLNAHLGRLLGECDLTKHERLRLESVREMTQPSMLGRAARIEALLDLADQANADGDLELAMRFLWRAALRCWTVSLGHQV
ncbi:MAG: AAA family ATPase, partial [Solirubrobacterales bacterium]|nr:AAA family ATPase [Solirubrobacterales bacterium]